MDNAAALALALELADAADAVTMARFRASDLVVDTKPDLTPVSEADHAAEVRIREIIADKAAHHSVAGEEFGDDGDAECRWIVDPIDGTKNYVRGVPIWATLIGFERAGELVAGVVSAPALQSRWWAARGGGAFRDGHEIHVSAVHDLADAHFSYASDRQYMADGVESAIADLSARCWRTRALGDFWQHVMVADGSFDIGFDPVLAYWDAAALLPIILEAGGRWTTIEGANPDRPESLVCTNGLVHDEVIAILAP
jgi:histidinol-phosphatase